MANAFLADNADLQECLEKLDAVQEELARELVNYGDACAALEFSRDRAKSALAEGVQRVWAEPENNGLAVSAAEHKARALPWYKERMKDLQGQHAKAEVVKTGYELNRTRLDILRSRLAVIRTQIGLI